MQIKMNINGVDFARWAVEGGITQTPIYRQSRSVTVLNGTLYKAEVEKRGIIIQLVELRDSTMKTLLNALTPLSTVEYTDNKFGDRTAKFYVTVSNTSAKKVIGGNTYYNGISIELEEK